MLTIVHLLFGVMLGKYIGNYWILIPLAIISHYILDSIPHFQPKPVKNYKENGLKGVDKKDFLLKSIEPLIGIILALYFIIANHSLNMLIGAFFSWVPDFFIFLSWEKIPPFSPLRNFEKKWHKHNRKFLGILTQLVVIIISIYFLIK